MAEADTSVSDADSPDDYLIVPMRLNALWVPEGTPQSRFAAPTSDFGLLRQDQTPYLSSYCLNPPFRQASNEFPPGVHLHWQLPSALTRAEQDKDGTRFPPVPNRWLLVRILTPPPRAQGKPELTAWVVESDFLSTDYARYGNSVAIPYQSNPDDENLFRYMGRKIPLDQWQEDRDAERFPVLTAIGYGDPAFAAYYPDCRSVFGLHDDKPPEPSQGQLSYLAIGWYADPTQDPLNDEKLREERLAAFGWQAPVGSGALPRRTLCHGMVFAVQPLSDGGNTSNDTTLDVALGHTLDEGIAALLPHLLSKQKTTADENTFSEQYSPKFLKALLSGRLPEARIDALADLESRLHALTFSSEPAGLTWDIEPPKPSASANRADELPAWELMELNRTQADYDRAIEVDLSRRRQLFLDWYKWMLCRYNKRRMPKDSDLDESSEYLKALAVKDYGSTELKARLDRDKQACQRKIPKGYELRQHPAPQFHQPNEPVIVLAGEALRPSPSAAEQTGDCRLASQPIGRQSKALLDTAPPDLSLDSLPIATPAGVLLEECLLIAEHFRRLPEDSGAPAPDFAEPAPWPPALACGRWQPRWQPLFVHWEAEYRPLQGASSVPPIEAVAPRVENGFGFSDNGLDLKPLQPALVDQRNPYQGIAILAESRLSSLASVAIRLGKPDLAEMLQGIGEVPVFAQALSGFNEALLMCRQEAQLPVRDPKTMNPIAMEFHENVRKYVGDMNRAAPMIDAFFYPLRAGCLRIEKLWIVDAFGQYRAAEPNKTFSLHGCETSASDMQSALYLPPRLTQASRLLARWIPFPDGGDHPGSEIYGWLEHNHLDRSLMVFDREGRPLGSLVSYEGKTRFHSISGKDQALEQSIPSNHRLRGLVQSVLDKGADYLDAFIETLEAALAQVAPAHAAREAALGLLTGRPIALVRLTISLELKGPAALHQGLESLIEAARSSPPPSKTRGDGGISGVRFPIRIGSTRQGNEYQDGLVGFFLEQGDQSDFSTFYCNQATPDSPADIRRPEDWTLSVACNSPLSLTLLFEPAGRLSVTSGILPKRTIELPTASFDRTLRTLQPVFSIGPLLSADPIAAQGPLKIPLPAEPGHQWSWLAASSAGVCPERPIDHDSETSLFAQAPKIIEGWLKLAHSSGEDHE